MTDRWNRRFWQFRHESSESSEPSGSGGSGGSRFISHGRICPGGSRHVGYGRLCSMAAAALLLAVALSGCTGDVPEATPTAARGRVTAEPLPPATETPIPPPTQPPLPDTPAPPVGADAAGAAPGAYPPGSDSGQGALAPAPGQQAMPATRPGDPPPAAGAAPVVPAGACRVVRETEQITLMPIWDAPVPVHEAWAQHSTPSVLAEVTEHNTEHRFHRLKGLEAPEGVPLEHDFVVSYDGQPVPLEIGRTYRFTAQRDIPGSTPVGQALRVDDDAGMAFLYVAARETDRAHDRVLAGDRGGVTVRQVASPCTEVIVDECGYELRSAPAEFELGGASLSLMRGVTGTLQSEPPYDVDLMTSHLRRWVGDLPCPDPTDWVLSYRLERQ